MYMNEWMFKKGASTSFSAYLCVCLSISVYLYLRLLLKAAGDDVFVVWAFTC